MHAILFNKKRKVAEVELENGLVTNVYDIIDGNELPVMLLNDASPEQFNKWLEKRKIPSTREGLKEARQAFGSDICENLTHMFALTDQYWFSTSKNDSWRKYNFFTNRYPTATGNALFFPYGELDIAELRKESPDSVTNGVVRKSWMQDENMDSWLIKAGSLYFHQEPLSEILASRMLDKINFIPFVSYEFFINGMRICSKCKNFVDENTEFIPAQAIYSLNTRPNDVSQYEHTVASLEAFGIKKPSEYIDKMLYVDELMGNWDRHLGNFGVIRNVETKEIVGMSPLFDFGTAFHEFFKVAKSKSRLFNEEMTRIRSLYDELPVFKNLLEYKDMFHVINIYPALSTQQKAAIKEGYLSRIKKFKYDEMEPSRSR